VEAQITALSGVTDETLRWIITIFMGGYRSSAPEAARKVMHAIAGMAGLPDNLIPLDLQKRIEGIAYEVLEAIVLLEVARKRSHAEESQDAPTHS
jgi:hypothetical protein